MAAHRLQPPANNFHALALDIVTVIPASLVRVSGHATGEPYFGRRGGNRFDDLVRGGDRCFEMGRWIFRGAYM